MSRYDFSNKFQEAPKVRPVPQPIVRTSLVRRLTESHWDGWRLSCALGFAQTSFLITGLFVGVTVLELDRLSIRIEE